MKSILVSIMVIITLQPGSVPKSQSLQCPAQVTGNIIIITTDGFRWQEVFMGADSALLHNEESTPGSDWMKLQFWAPTREERRKKLLPFFWNVLATKGQVYGNRLHDNKVDVSNNFLLSYPGYNEIFTGNADPAISSNNKFSNANINLLEYLNGKDEFKGKVAAFTSWDVFPYIFNEERSGFPVNSGFEKTEGSSATQAVINRMQEESISNKQSTRFDQLTFLTAKEYLQQKFPRVFYLGLGETDEFAHEGRYDLYLQQAARVDQMISELWHWVQTTPGYKDNTTFIITTDHGRGRKKNKWTSHNRWIAGSVEVWLAVIGPGIEPLGEIKENQQLYQKQLAQTIANLLGENFEPGHEVAAAITLPALFHAKTQRGKAAKFSFSQRSRRLNTPK